MSLLTRSCCAVLVIALGVTAFPAWPAQAGTLPATQQEFQAEVDRRDWDAALTVATQRVASARKKAAQEPLQLVEALSLVGDAQLGKADYVNAQSAFAEALQLAEQHAGHVSASLVDPLRGLGETFAATDRHEQAVPYFDRALLITHRSRGLFDVSQQPILRQLAASLTRLGRVEEAERHLNYLLQVGERLYGRRDPQLAPLLCSIGDWYADTGNFRTARSHYRRAIETVENKLGRDSLAVVEPLRSLAHSYTQELDYSILGREIERPRIPTDADGTSNKYQVMNPRQISEDGEKALERALKILDAQPTLPRERLAQTLIQAGDWYQIKHQPEKALSHYKRAASLGSTRQPTDEPGKGKGGAPLSFPVRIYYPKPMLAMRNQTLSADQVDESFVQVEFTVTGQGEVTDARVVEENGTSRQVAEALQAIRDSRFRPKFVNGEPVATSGMVNREIFKTRKETGEAEES